MKFTTRTLEAVPPLGAFVGRTKAWLILAAFVVVLASTPAAHAGLIINPTFDSTFGTLDAQAVKDAFNYAAHEFETRFTDNIHVNINVSSSNGGLGSSSTFLYKVGDYAAVKAALAADNAAHPSAAGTSSVSSLSADPTSGGTFWVSTAEAKALGLTLDNSSTDGTFKFNRNLSYTFDPNNRGVAGEYDFIGVAEHEISEIMGRIGLLGATIGSTGNSYSADDLFRFTANGVRNVNPNTTNVYLSADNGATNLAGFNGPGGGDLSDYNGAVATDPFNAFTGTNQAHSLNQADFTNLDIIGYDLAQEPQATPEPATMTLLGIGVVGLAGYGWRRRKGIARAA